MEKLGDSRDFHLHHDLGILYDDCWRSTGSNDHSMNILTNLICDLKLNFHITYRLSQFKSSVSKK